MSEITFIFTAGMTGVFLSMAVLYCSIRLTTLASESLDGSKEDNKKND
ncbi:Uncharacterized protein dnl_11280 [Desulfonema limicola]|uniref:Uncharacterized protein n=1 Tax=Desulfonema limicola TaxID=45656 RepID=A0A975GF53_9BACT|nr:hypothetical protein [Desulfonema limicola]QTA78883.1 Uncharacterized protein dnl_11280 [Desulfonema limicola]